MVAVFHVQWLTSLHFSPFIQNAYLFVDFFFVLSGFIIAMRYAGDATCPFNARGFIVKRFFRLYPLHIATTLTFLALILTKQFFLPAFTTLSPRGPLPDDYTISVVLHLLMLHAVNNHHGAVLNVPSWSIAAEFWTYCVFCVCCIVTRRPGLRIVLVAGVGAVAFMALVPFAEAGGLWSAPRMLRCLAAFGLGTIVWAAVTWLPLRIEVHLTDVLYVALLALLYLLLDNTNNSTPTNMLALPLFAGVIWLTAVDRGSRTRRLLEAAPLIAVGRWSYSIYMLHFMLATIIGVLLERERFPRVDVGNINALMVLPGTWGDILLFGYLAILVSTAALTFKIIERPWRDAGRRFSNAGTPMGRKSSWVRSE